MISSSSYLLFIVNIFLMWIAFIFGAYLPRRGWQGRLLKRKLIQFNPQTGELEWMDGTKV